MEILFLARITLCRVSSLFLPSLLRFNCIHRWEREREGAGHDDAIKRKLAALVYGGSARGIGLGVLCTGSGFTRFQLRIFNAGRRLCPVETWRGNYLERKTFRRGGTNISNHSRKSSLWTLLYRYIYIHREFAIYTGPYGNLHVHCFKTTPATDTISSRKVASILRKNSTREQLSREPCTLR